MVIATIHSLCRGRDPGTYACWSHAPEWLFKFHVACGCRSDGHTGQPQTATKTADQKGKERRRVTNPINQFPRTICLSHFIETPMRASVQSTKCGFQELCVMEYMWNYVCARMKIILATEITIISQFKDCSTSPKRWELGYRDGSMVRRGNLLLEGLGSVPSTHVTWITTTPASGRSEAVFLPLRRLHLHAYIALFLLPPLRNYKENKS